MDPQHHGVRPSYLYVFVLGLVAGVVGGFMVSGVFGPSTVTVTSTTTVTVPRIVKVTTTVFVSQHGGRTVTVTVKPAAGPRPPGRLTLEYAGGSVRILADQITGSTRNAISASILVTVNVAELGARLYVNLTVTRSYANATLTIKLPAIPLVKLPRGFNTTIFLLDEHGDLIGVAKGVIEIGQNVVRAYRFPIKWLVGEPALEQVRWIRVVLRPIH